MSAADAKELGGHNTNDLSNLTITHFILALTPRYEKEVFSLEDVMGTYKSHRVIREHSKWLNPSNRVFHADQNNLENRTKMVVRRGWLEDVITGKLGLTEEGEWGVLSVSVSPLIFCKCADNQPKIGSGHKDWMRITSKGGSRS